MLNMKKNGGNLKMKYHGLVIADLHVGAMNLEKTHEEVSKVFVEKIKDSQNLQFIIIAGDFFDHKLFLQEQATFLGYSILIDIINICRERDIKLRIVYGTESHEVNQYDLISVFSKDTDVKVIKEVAEEELLPGLQVLYLPEEHIANKDEYYKDFFSNENKYDYIFGHGIIREVTSDLARHAEDTSDNKRLKVPVFNTRELGYICKGQVFFGHYHINQSIDDKYFSIGSFSRWKYGEEGRKGFYEVTCNPEKEKYKAEYIENDLAETYTTISYGYDDEIFQSEQKFQDALTHVDKLLDDHIFDHVRFIFNVPESMENPESTITHLRERFKSKENMKLEIQHGYIETKREKQKEVIDSENKKYGFIRDINLPLEEKTSRFISIEYGKEIPSSRIKSFMMDDIKDIFKEVFPIFEDETITKTKIEVTD